MTVWHEVASRVREIARHEARSVAPSTERYKVRHVDPLVVTQVNGDLVLEEGDEDVEVERSLIDTPPEVGDGVIVHHDTHGDFVIAGVLDE